MTLSSSPLFLAAIARAMQALGNSMGATFTISPCSQRVSLVAVYWSFARAPMSPALSLSRAMVFLPRIRKGAEGFSAFSLFTL